MNVRNNMHYSYLFTLVNQSFSILGYGYFIVTSLLNYKKPSNH